ncbi:MULTISPECIES: hypothetical protein [Desulfovibrio]|uniref:hypothetical protein n=1 Tax=Desulfovibrio TaxID=872 RepID=UPI000421F674|nr:MULTISPECIES: hypothetical protein [Desulfovibrio]HMM38871.1 hypothetical protein [Desulfovibrio sp.]
MTPAREPSGTWRLERRLDLGTLLSVASALAVAAALVSGLGERLRAAEDQICRVERRLEEGQATALKVERVEERIVSIQAMLQEIKDQLKTRREGR